MLVTGAAGMVGSYAPRVFNNVDIALTDVVGNFSQLDVGDPGAVLETVRDVRPDVILHLAAATDVDRCQQEPDWAYAANAIGTQNVALACQATGALLVYISTGNVFSGDKHEPYTEFDSPAPLNVYGQSKLAGEKIVSDLLQRHYIVRAGWMIGGGPKDKKFVGKIAELLLRGDSELKIVDDKFGSPTFAQDLLAGIKKLIESDWYGTYHLVNPGVASRYEIAVTLRGFLGRSEVSIESVSSAFFPTLAPRIRMEALRNYKLELLGCEWMRPWQAALEDYLSEELVPYLSTKRLSEHQ